MKYFFYILICGLAILACKQDAKPAKVNENPRDAALNRLTELINSEGRNPQLRYERAEVLYERGMYDEATEDLRIAILTDSMQPKYYHLLSDVFMDNANSSKSILTMEKAVALFPTRIPTLLKMAENYLIVQNYDQSISTVNEILRQSPQNAEAYYMLGLNFKEMGDTRRAINSFQTATEMDAKLIDAWISLGGMYEKTDPKQALKIYDNALIIEPKNINALHSKAFFLQNHKDVPGALALYREINGIDRNYTPAYLNAGILMIEQDSFNNALEQFNILTGINPQGYLGYYYRALVQERMGNKENALLDLKTCLNLNPEYEKAQELQKKLMTAK